MSNEAHDNVLPKAVRDKIAQADAIYQAVYNPEPGPKEPAKEPAKEPVTVEGWEQKYKVLKGKYDAEVPRLSRQLRETSTANNDLKNRVNALEATVQALKTAAPATPKAGKPALTPEEVEQFGPDLVDVIERKAQEVADKIVAAKLGPIEKSVKQVNESVASQKKTVAQSDRERMLADLEEAVPEWRKQNEDEKFLNWLELEDPYAGKLRAELLAEALQQNNAKRVIALFKGFQQENAVVAPENQPSKETPATEPEKEPAKKPEQPLDELVAPGTPKTGATGAQKEAGKRIWTRKEIEEFTREKNEFVRRFPERDLPENLQALDRDLFKAQVEDRIRF